VDLQEYQDRQTQVKEPGSRNLLQTKKEGLVRSCKEKNRFRERIRGKSVPRGVWVEGGKTNDGQTIKRSIKSNDIKKEDNIPPKRFGGKTNGREAEREKTELPNDRRDQKTTWVGENLGETPQCTAGWYWGKRRRYTEEKLKKKKARSGAVDAMEQMMVCNWKKRTERVGK